LDEHQFSGVGIALAVSIVAGVLSTQVAAAAGPNDARQPVSHLLTSDGTLNLSAGYSGPLDSSGYNVSLDPARGPVFRP
jgi:hypothetical protein